MTVYCTPLYFPCSDLPVGIPSSEIIPIVSKVHIPITINYNTKCIYPVKIPDMQIHIQTPLMLHPLRHVLISSHQLATANCATKSEATSKNGYGLVTSFSLLR